jgi:pimeloyl-ACP methyl ester carboxylesterase
MAHHESGFAEANGIRLAYQVDGAEQAEPVLIIMGLGGQMVDGPDALSSDLVKRGFRSIRFDNRDVGHSTHLKDKGMPPPHSAILEALSRGEPAPVAYTLNDMALDALHLMNALRVQSAHVIGGSMGGMVGTLLAADHPDRVRSFAAIISSSGNPAIPYGPGLAKLSEGASANDSDQQRFERKFRLFKALQGSGFRLDDAVLRQRIRADMLRSDDDAGVARQSAAGVPFSDRRSFLRRIRVPTVIIQGGEDPLFPVAHGEDMAANVPDSELLVVPGLGHELPDGAVPVVVDAIVKNIRRATVRSANADDV